MISEDSLKMLERRRAAVYRAVDRYGEVGAQEARDKFSRAALLLAPNLIAEVRKLRKVRKALGISI